MSTITLIGRILFSLVFLASGLGHFAQTEAMTGYAKFKKVPAAKLSVLASGALMVLGAAGIILGVWADLAALVLAALAFVTGVWMHNFWTVTDPQMKAAEQAGFFKNISLAGAGLALFVFARDGGDLFGWTLGNPLF
jgi:putative oxidoreductase